MEPTIRFRFRCPICRVRVNRPLTGRNLQERSFGSPQETDEKGSKTRKSSSERPIGFAMSHLYLFGPYLLDPQRRTLCCDKSLVPLTPKAFDVLLFLAQNPNRLITKDELLRAVWGDTFVEEANLTQYIAHLRKALADNSEDSRLIVTISRKGYQFTADVVLSEGADIPKRDEAQVLTSGVSTPGITVEAKARNQSSQTGTPAITELPRAQGAVQKPGNHWRIAAAFTAIAF